MQRFTLRNAVTFIPVTATALALSVACAEARGAGITQKSSAEDARHVGRAANPPKEFPQQPAGAGEAIVARRTLVQVQASEAAGLLDELQLQLAAQPGAKLSISWRLTRPAGVR
ncbi:MAG: hypothetical protein L0Y57_11535 [Beijerinckiaceae bacterium]|nr:hypothetical protein [Beijerinckiaceae bacterium]